MTQRGERPSLSGPYRDGLLREVPFTMPRGDRDESGDGLNIDGYGAVFDQVTRIDSWEGTFDEVIQRGAFRKSVRERVPLMQYDHGRHPLIGSLPLGRWTQVAEDEHGLHVVGRLTDNWLIQPVRDAIRDGGVSGMSFRFSVVKDRWVDAAGKVVRDDELAELLFYGAGDRGPLQRTLIELKVSEVGPVAWPAYEATSVGVRDAHTSRFVVDLGRLDLRTHAARAELARAVTLADLAVSQIPSVPSPADGSPSSTTPSATPEPQATAPAGAHSPAGQRDEPGATDQAAGKHSSPPRPGTRLAARAAAIRERTRQLPT